MNLITTPGFYHCRMNVTAAGILNCPDDLDNRAFTLIVTEGVESCQILIRYDSGAMFFRDRYANLPWKRYLTQAETKKSYIEKFYLARLGVSTEQYQEFASCYLSNEAGGVQDFQQFSCMITGIDISDITAAFVTWRGTRSTTNNIGGVNCVSVFQPTPRKQGEWDIGYYVDEEYVAHFMLHTKGFFRGRCCIEILNANYQEDLASGQNTTVFSVKPMTATKPEGYTPFLMKTISYAE